VWVLFYSISTIQEDGQRREKEKRYGEKKDTACTQATTTRTAKSGGMAGRDGEFSPSRDEENDERQFRARVVVKRWIS
jgi:hypothetical protein